MKNSHSDDHYAGRFQAISDIEQAKFLLSFPAPSPQMVMATTLTLGRVSGAFRDGYLAVLSEHLESAQEVPRIGDLLEFCLQNAIIKNNSIIFTNH